MGSLTERVRPHGAIGLVALLAALWSWWAVKQGAYFDTVFLPGAVGLFLVALLLLWLAPFGGRIAGVPLVSVGCLVGLAFLTALSLLWTTARDVAIADGLRALLYATAFVVGMWTCLLAGRRMSLSLVPVAAAGVFAAIFTLFTIGFGENASFYLHEDGTLRFPIGYRNANALFFLISLWAVLSLASIPKVDWKLRVGLIACGTLLLDLIVLSQSRGSIPGAAISVIIFLALSPVRPRAAASVVLAAIPVVPFLGPLLDPFQNGSFGPDAVPLLHDAAIASALSVVASAAVAFVWLGIVRPQMNISERTARRGSIGTAVAVAFVAIAVSVVFTVRQGGPIEFVDQKVQEFNRVGYPSFEGEATRYGANVGSNRSDFWRVSLDMAQDAPLFGQGAGSFRFEYLKERRSDEAPEDPHSVEMALLAELGVTGFLLFAVFIATGAVAARRARRLGPHAATVSSGALACLAAWLTQSSYDWFFQYPAVTAPVIGLLGAAMAPGLIAIDPGRGRRIRLAAMVPLVLAILVAVPLLVATRYEQRGLEKARVDPEEALKDLRRASDINVFSPSPALAEGVLAQRLGDEERAEAALLEAYERQPESYAAPYYLASLLGEEEPQRALSYARLARRLNPSDPLVERLERRLLRTIEAPG